MTGYADYSSQFTEHTDEPRGNGKAQYKGRIQLIPFQDIRLGDLRRDLVRGWIPRVGIIVVWGAPKCGKSFWTFDLMMHIARGIDYRGRRVQQGAVVYCAFEGQTGIRARVEAYRLRCMDGANDPVPFFLQPLRLEMVTDHIELIEAIRAQLSAPPAAVVLDTLNRSLRGSENSDEDMGDYIRAADAIREAFQCAVIIIHHCGVKETRPRGHTSLQGAEDVEIVIKDTDGSHTATIECAKDGPADDEIAFRLDVVDVGFDEDGERITSCVVVPAEGTAKVKQAVPLTENEKGWLKDLNAIFAEPGLTEMASPTLGMPEVPILTRELTRDRLKAKGRFTLDANGNLTQADRTKLCTALNNLRIKGKIAMTDKVIWLINERDG